MLKEFSRIYKGKISFSDFSRPTPEYEQAQNEIFIDCSSTTQTLSGLLLVLPLMNEKYTIFVENLKSKSYIDLTLQTLERHGIYTQNQNYEKFITTPSEYKPATTEIEGDYSQSAFFIVANLLGADIKIHDLNLFSKQADKEIINILNFMPKNINASNTPDIIPPLAVLACFNDYDTTFTNIEKLKTKESDRVRSILELNKIGANIKEDNGKLIVEGKGKNFVFSNGTVSTFDDHRIAMMFAICAQKADGGIEIDDEKCVEKSYPEFWNIFKELGGKIS
jgi:3-phosphoshikimate 1-carboxyvinyltransferase